MLKNINKKLAIGLFLCFSVVFTCYIVGPAKNKTSSLGLWGTDHVSHWNTAILFAYRGFKIYSKPSLEICPLTKYQDRVYFGLCNIPEREGKTRLFINWPQYPRPYPPGEVIFHSPQALLNEIGLIDTKVTNILTIVSYLIVAFILSYFFITSFIPSSSRPLNYLIYAILLYAGLEVVFWSLVGFFDIVAIMLIVLSLRQLLQFKNFENSALLFSIATFFHYRSLWFLPIYFISCYQLFGLYKRNLLSKHQIVKISVSIVLGLIAASTFFASFHAIKEHTAQNMLYYQHLFVTPYQYLLILFWLSFCFVLWKAGKKEMATIALWNLMFLIATPQVRQWHGIMLLPYLIGIFPINLKNQSEESKIFEYSSVACTFVFYLIVNGLLFTNYGSIYFSIRHLF